MAVHAMWEYRIHKARRPTDFSEKIKRITLFSSLRVSSNFSTFQCVILRCHKLLILYSVDDTGISIEHW
jgi:hypothetical protein